MRDHFTLLRIVVFALALTACSSTPSELTLPPAAPTATLDAVGAKTDKLDGRIAAAVKTAHDHADSPAIVKAETLVALAGLPVPSPGDLAYANARAMRADPADYKRDNAWSAKTYADIEKMWQTMEREKEANLAAMTKLKDEIDTLNKQVDQAKRDIWTYIGGAMVFLGALSLAFASKPAGLFLMLGGFGAGAFSLLLGTDWFVPCVGALVLVGAVIAYVHYFRKHTHKDEQKDEAK